MASEARSVTRPPAEPDPAVADASRRTYLAAERTYLAWFRTGLAALAVSLGVGRLVPSLIDASPGPFVALGVGFALLGGLMIALGAARLRAVRRSLAGGAFIPLSDATVITLAATGLLLAIATIVLVVAAL
jgi:putative membrane protein